MTNPTPRVQAAPAPQVGHPPSGRPPIVPLALFGAGVFLVWFGVHYWRDTQTKYPTDVIKSVLQGQGIPKTLVGTPVAGTVEAAPGYVGGIIPNPQGGGIAGYALQFVGQGYVYGGRAERPGDWDCSSFLSYVLGHGFGLVLPGGGHYGDPGYPPNEHGPVASAYKLYGAYSVDQSNIAVGDLAVWNTHCGICIGGGRIVAARSPDTGTGTSSIDGVTQELAETPVFRRLTSQPGDPGTGGAGGHVVAR